MNEHSEFRCVAIGVGHTHAVATVAWSRWTSVNKLGQVAGLLGTHMNGLIPFWEDNETNDREKGPYPQNNNSC